MLLCRALVQSMKVSAKKAQRSYLSWHWTVMQNLNKSWPCGVKTGMKMCTWMGSFCPKRNVSSRKFQRNHVPWHWKVTQNLSKNWLVAWKMTGNLINLHASNWMSENFQLMGSFCRKHIKFYMKKHKKVISHDTGEWCKVWRKTGSWFRKWHDKFGKF